MKLYVAGLLCGFFFMLLAWYGLFYLQMGSPTPKSMQSNMILSYKYALAERSASPRIILVGGSNTLHSISAEQIQMATNIPAYNFGANAGLGIDYILYDTKKHLRSGDIVILSLEYQHYQFDHDINDLTVGYPVAFDPLFFQRYSTVEKLKRIYAMDFFRLIQGLKGIVFPMKGESMGFYIPAMNKHGDITSAKENKKSIAMAQKVASISPLRFDLNLNFASWRILQSFIEWSHERGVRVLIAYPPLLEHPDYKKDEATSFFAAIQHFAEENDVDVMGEPSASMYPAADFFDSVYHLHSVAREKHTKKLIDKLRLYLGT